MGDKAWKKLERRIGKLFGGERVKRMGDYSQSATDVILHDLPEIKIDCKLRRRLPHHTLFREHMKKAAKSRSRPILITRDAAGERLYNLDADHFAELLVARREGRRPKGKALVVEQSRARFGHHAMFREVTTRYCRGDGEHTVLVTKEHKKHLYLVSISPEFYDQLSALGVRRIKSRTASAGGFGS
jgi:hypothetical protein